MSRIRSLDYVLENAPETARVMDHARLLIRLGRLYEALVPGPLARVSRVANIKSGIVVIHAETGAAAAKIKQIAGRLADELLRQGAECNGIEVRVQPSRLVPAPSTISVRPLSEKAASSLTRTIATLPEDSALRAAMSNLLNHSAR